MELLNLLYYSPRAHEPMEQLKMRPRIRLHPKKKESTVHKEKMQTLKLTFDEYTVIYLISHDKSGFIFS